MSCTKAPAIGIDLGTSHCSVAVFENGKVTIIANDQGNQRTPSYVAFTDTERVLGDAAKYLGTMDPANTIFDALRLIGRKFEDPLVQGFMKYWPFEVISDDLGRATISVDLKGERKLFYPEEICSMLLAEMKDTADKYLGRPVTTDAVVTVPVYFNYTQRQAIRDAGIIAGLNVIRIINAPLAAAIAQRFYDGKVPIVDERQSGSDTGEKNVLIFDLGGGTLDVSILTIEDNIFEVKSIAGKTHVGGEDFVNRMLTHFVEVFWEKYDRDITTRKRAIRRLRNACEIAKKSLSSSTETFIKIDNLFDDIDFHESISRTLFEAINADFFCGALEQVEKCLRDAKMKKSQIDDIFLVGGSTRIPKIRQMLHEFFNGKELKRMSNSDEAVAHGAAIYAAVLSGDRSEKLQDFLFLDVTPISLGVENNKGVMATVIKRNTNLPTKQSQDLTISTEDLHGFSIKVYEGEKAMAKDNNFLGELKFLGIVPRPGEAEVEVTFDIDWNGILRVNAIEKLTGNLNEVSLDFDMGYFNKEEIERMINDAEAYKAKEEMPRGRFECSGSGGATIYEVFEFEEMDQSEPLNIIAQDTLVIPITKRILLEEIATDFAIVCGSGAEAEIKCHKAFLCAQSGVLRAVIERSGSEAVTNRMEMADMKEDSVKAFLAFLYYRDTTEASKNSAIAFELLRAAHKYEIESLQIAMKSMILAKGTSWFIVDDAVRLFAFARHLENGEDLKMMAVEILKKNISTLEKSDCYKELYKNDPESAMDLYKCSISN